MMAISERDAELVLQLREMLGEAIPEGGSDTDTLFSDQRLMDLLEVNYKNLQRAAHDGWRIKAAEFANLVNVTDGAASRELGELHKKALDMVKLYQRSSTGPTDGRSRVGRIVRREY